MTSVNITTVNNTVDVTTNDKTVVVKSPVTTTVTATTTGPQGATGATGPTGAAGPQGPQGPAGGTFSQNALDDANVVDGSVIYYHASSGEYKANSTWTVSTIVFGGNF